MENYEMLKALYDFEAAHAKTISFDEGEYFVLYQTSSKQRNWWPVVNIKGNIGFVPSNYVTKLKVEPRFLVSFLDSSIAALRKSQEDNVNGIIKKDELLQRLTEKKQLIEETLSPSEKDYECSEKEYSYTGHNNHKYSDIQDDASLSPTVVYSKPQIIQESPSMGALNIKLNDSAQDLSSEQSQNTTTIEITTRDVSVSEVNNVENNGIEEEANRVNSENDSNPDYDENNKSDVKSVESVVQEISLSSRDVYRVIDSIRRNTNLSFDLSCEALRVVLSNFEQLFPNVLNPYLEAVAVHITERPIIPKELLGMTHDAKRLQYIFSQLADCKNDAEQRTWMLIEDEDDIVQFLEELVDILNNADENICCYEMSCDHYQSLINLVQYYQMETRWSIKNLLLKVFTAACHLDHIAVDILLTSILPLEIVEDMKNNSSDLDKFVGLVKMLTTILSLGQAIPINHREHLDIHFVTFLFEIVEQNPSDAIVDLVIALILAFNLQFNDFTQNTVLEAMLKLSSAKIFTEKILLLLNREEDPVRILRHSTNNINSVLKMFEDLLSLPETAGFFYTNDNKVLIDILVRQLSDLSMGDPMRRHYLELCRKILRNTNYEDHTHRKQDLMKIFTRIFCEETECSASDQQLVRDIANEFPHIFKA